MDSYIRTPYTKQRRGSFVLVLPTGRKLRFADAIHRGQAYELIARGRFAHMGEMVDYARSLPRGYVDFTPLTPGSASTFET